MTDSVDRLYEDVLAARQADPQVSRTSRLLNAGRAKVSKKLAEEAIEVVIDAMQGDRAAVVRESADLLYNLVVLWASCDVHPRDVWKEMTRREQLFGIAEKLSKRTIGPKTAPKPRRAMPKARRKAAAPRGRTLAKRRR
jgi:phosphoribosyl-ATP pyrophosphohydrolase